MSSEGSAGPSTSTPAHHWAICDAETVKRETRVQILQRLFAYEKDVPREQRDVVFIDLIEQAAKEKKKQEPPAKSRPAPMRVVGHVSGVNAANS
jgi:hypothetical protein